VIPEPQYSTPIMINPAAFKWRPYLDGLSVKTLGRFSDEDLALSAIRWDSRRSLELPLGRTQVLLCTEGAFSVNGTSYPKHSLVWSDWDEAVDVTAPEGTEVLRFEFAELDS
jgi:redox-sensitive bicupin YhaK (pirin superfamily)